MSLSRFLASLLLLLAICCRTTMEQPSISLPPSPSPSPSSGPKPEKRVPKAEVDAVNALLQLSRIPDTRPFSSTSCGSQPSSYAIKCNCTSPFCRVTEIDLSGHILRGRIPDAIGNLTQLTLLDLSNNRLLGPIPSSFVNLSQLSELYLGYNNLEGNLSLLSEMKSLQSLYLLGNQFKGSIPPEFGSLPSLEYLSISNNLLSGSIPIELGNISSLIELYLYNNLLTEQFPPDLGNLSNIEFIDSNVSVVKVTWTAKMPGQKIETGHQDTVHDVAMDYYGKRLATASSDNTIKIIGVSNSNSQHLATLSGHQGPVWQVAWAHPKFGSLLSSCSYDGKVIIWKEGTQNEWSQANIFDDHKASVNSIAWAPHEFGLCLACGSSDGNISVFTARSDGGWDTSRIEPAHPVGVTSVSWAPSTAPGALVCSTLLNPVQKLVSGGCDNTVKVWKLHDGIWKMDCYPALQMHTDWVRDVAWAPNLGLPKSTIASASQDGKVIIWTVAKEGDPWEGKVLKDFGTPVWRVSWSLTGNILAVADGQNNVTLWKEAVDGAWQQVTTVDP